MHETGGAGGLGECEQDAKAAEFVYFSAAALEFLSRTATDLVGQAPGEDLFEYVGNQITPFVRNGYVVVSSYDPAAHVLAVHSVWGEPDGRAELLELLGSRPVSIDEKDIQELRAAGSGRFAAGSLFETALRQLPPDACESTVKRLRVRGCCRMVLGSGHDLFGTVLILTTTDSFAAMTVIETFLNQASVALTHRRAEEELERSERLYRHLVDSSVAGVFRERLDGTYVFANSAMARMYGFGSPEEMIGINAGATYRRREDRPKLLDLLLREGAVRSHELEIVRREGERRHVLISAALEKNEIFGTVVDITDLKSSQHALRDSEQRFRVALECSPVVVFQQDREMRYTWVCNPQFGYPAADILGRTDADLLEPAGATRLAALKRAVLDSGTGRRAEVAVQKDGETHFCDVTMEALRGANGEILGITGAMIDITERKRQEEKLRQLNERLRQAEIAKNNFLAVLSHELRNHLAAVRNAFELLKFPGTAAEETAWATDLIGRQLRAMARMLDDLLDVSRAARGKMALHKERCDLGEVARGAARTSGALVEERRHTFSVEIPPEPLLIDGDPVRLEQIIVNLLNNAAKYTECRGRIRLSVKADKGEAIIKVADNGAGIQADMLHKIFDLYMQVTPRTGEDHSQTGGGLGIGLALVKQLVRLHGGTISAESAGSGKGSIFTVRLPLAPRPASESK